MPDSVEVMASEPGDNTGRSGSCSSEVPCEPLPREYSHDLEGAGLLE